MAITYGILTYLAIAAFYDLRFRIIPNMLIVLGMISAYFITIAYSGLGSGIRFFLHLIIVVVILFPLYLMGVIGAGDVKLLSLVSAMLDGRTIFFFIITSLFIGGAYSAVRIIRARDHFARVIHIRDYFLGIITTGKVSEYVPLDKKSGYIPFGVCIFLGFFIVSIFNF